MVKVKYQTGHSFWLYSFHHRYKYGKGQKGVAKWFDPMRSKFFLLFFTGFDILRRTFGARTSAMLMLARKPSIVSSRSARETSETPAENVRRARASRAGSIPT